MDITQDFRYITSCIYSKMSDCILKLMMAIDSDIGMKKHA